MSKLVTQTLLNQLADRCLENAETYHGYTDKDLVNATLIFSHFMIDKMFQKNKHITFGNQIELAEATGKAIHSLVQTVTGKDMKKIIKEV